MTTKSSAKSSPRARSSSSSTSAKAHAKASARPSAKSRASHASKTAATVSSRSGHATKSTPAARSGHATKSTGQARRSRSAALPQPPAPSDIPTALTDPQSFERQVEPSEALRASGVTEAEARTPHEALTDAVAQSLPQRLDEIRALPGQVRDLVLERVHDVRNQLTEKLDALRAWPKQAVQSVLERAGEISGLRRLLAPSAAE